MSSPPLAAEYVIVGSGAGGGPLAVRLAAAGHSVLVLEAGELATGPVYDVPVFHAFATESPDMAWNFFVSHYDNEAQAKRDQKYDAGRGGVLYPRSATIGGCTAHNAMITVYPNDADFDAIADLTGDPSWRAAAMRTYFERLERCTYRNKWTATVLSRLGRIFAALDVRGHGFHGWLPTSIGRPALLAKDWQLIKAVASAAEKELSALCGKPLKPWQRLSRWWFDPNIAALQHKKDSLLGLWLIPLAVGAGRRHGTREPLLEAAAAPGSTLRILSGCYATRLLLDEQNRCTGVEFVTGAHLYRADPNASGARPGPAQVAVATREVIVAGGTFNTPQLLKLSGIGPADELREFGIEVRVDLPGVGANLQDRYEISVVTDLPRQLDLLAGGAFRPPRPGDTEPDPLLAAWRDGKGPYTTNGGLLAVVASSSSAAPVPDLFLFAVPADFRGYRVGYAEDLGRNKDRLTWVDPQGAHQQPGGQRPAEVGRPARPTRDPVPLLRGRLRRIRGGPRRRGGRGQARARPHRPPRRVGRARDLPRPGRRHRRRDPPVRPRQRMGPPRLRHLRNRAERRPERGDRQPVPSPRRRGPAGRRRLGVPPDSGLFHRHRRLHDQRESGRRDPR